MLDTRLQLQTLQASFSGHGAGRNQAAPIHRIRRVPQKASKLALGGAHQVDDIDGSGHLTGGDQVVLIDAPFSAITAQVNFEIERAYSTVSVALVRTAFPVCFRVGHVISFRNRTQTQCAHLLPRADCGKRSRSVPG